MVKIPECNQNTIPFIPKTFQLKVVKSLARNPLRVS